MLSQESFAEFLGSALRSPVVVIVLTLGLIFFAFMAAFTQRALKEGTADFVWEGTLRLWRKMAWLGLVCGCVLLFMVTIVLG